MGTKILGTSWEKFVYFIFEGLVIFINFKYSSSSMAHVVNGGVLSAGANVGFLHSFIKYGTWYLIQQGVLFGSLAGPSTWSGEIMNGLLIH